MPVPGTVGNVGIKADIQSAIQSYKLPVVLNRQNGMTTTHVDTRIMTTIDNGPQPRKEWVLGSNMSSWAQFGLRRFIGCYVGIFRRIFSIRYIQRSLWNQHDCSSTCANQLRENVNHQRLQHSR